MRLRIKSLLKARNMTIAELARQIDISPQNVGKLVNGETRPSIKTYKRVADALDVPFTDLFDCGCKHKRSPSDFVIISAGGKLYRFDDFVDAALFLDGELLSNV